MLLMAAFSPAVYSDWFAGISGDALVGHSYLLSNPAVASLFKGRALTVGFSTFLIEGTASSSSFFVFSNSFPWNGAISVGGIHSGIVGLYGEYEIPFSLSYVFRGIHYNIALGVGASYMERYLVEEENIKEQSGFSGYAGAVFQFGRVGIGDKFLIVSVGGAYKVLPESVAGYGGYASGFAEISLEKTMAVRGAFSYTLGEVMPSAALLYKLLPWLGFVVAYQSDGMSDRVSMGIMVAGGSFDVFASYQSCIFQSSIMVPRLSVVTTLRF